MASKKVLNLQNLAALGANDLAELVMELVEGNAAAKRLARAKLAGALGPEDLAREIRKRLTSLRNAKSFVDWHKIRPLVADIDSQRKLIAEKVAPKSPVLATDLLFKFLELATPIYHRCDDSNGELSDVFRQAILDLGQVLPNAGMDNKKLAEVICDLSFQNDMGEYDDLAEHAAPALKQEGLLHLRELVLARKQQIKPPAEKPDVDSLIEAEVEKLCLAAQRRGVRLDDDYEEYLRQIASFNIGRQPVQRAQEDYEHRIQQADLILAEVADALGDVDGFSAIFGDQVKNNQHIAMLVARRLIDANRGVEALAVLQNCKSDNRRGAYLSGWNELFVEATEAAGKTEEAQTCRRKLFSETLNTEFLRAYIKRLPDFDDEEAEQEALDEALNFESFHTALEFFIAWPDLGRAAKLILHRTEELNGDAYWILTPASEQLADRNPLATTLMLRAMIDFTMSVSRTKRYGYAAKHLNQCASLAEIITDYEGHATHEDYHATLRQKYPLRQSFWSKV